MVKSNGDYRMSKAAKTSLALMKGDKNGWKKMWIDAELSEKAARSAKFSEKKGEE